MSSLVTSAQWHQCCYPRYSCIFTYRYIIIDVRYVTPIMMCHSCSKDILVLKRCHLETFMLSHVTWNNKNISDTKMFRVFFSSASCPSSYSILVNGLFASNECYRKKRLKIRDVSFYPFLGIAGSSWRYLPKHWIVLKNRNVTWRATQITFCPDSLNYP